MFDAEFVLRGLADSEFEDLANLIPVDPHEKFVLFVEVMRVFDYWAVYKDEMPEDLKGNNAEQNLLRLGWELVIKTFFVELGRPGIPVRESSSSTRKVAKYLLYRLGVVAHLRNLADFVKVGLADLKVESGRYRIVLSESLKYQTMDCLEFYYASVNDDMIRDSDSEFVNGWKKFEFDETFEGIKELGAFYGYQSTSLHSIKKVDNVRDLMEPLIFPVDFGHGVMMGYDAILEVDEHFYSFALDYVRSAQEFAGLHPTCLINQVPVPEFVMVVAVVVALHLKHMTFGDIALYEYPEISLPQSLTIWTPREELLEVVELHTNFDRELIERAIDAIVFSPKDLEFIGGGGYVTPLLFDLGQGTLLRPVCGLLRNPFFSIIELNQKRDNKFINHISKPREDWFRIHVYGLFMGNRYRRVEGNIKLREAGRDVTDLDGVVYDTVSGDLAIFQLKWQDGFTYDVKKMRSKAKNLVDEIAAWGEAVNQWLVSKESIDVFKALRLKVPRGASINNVYFFGLSWSFFRSQALGYEKGSRHVVTCNWPMFRKARFDVGQSFFIFGELFEALVAANDNIDKCIVLDNFELEIGGRVVEFDGTFHAFKKAD
ncbi:hypothetical protein [Pseudomonas sp. NPDC089401]|uniref:hypothetical protein n=1 Tax=Pseudomonas sp. NPDC089401 TaxID=3364462 RepID=UPI003823EF4E